MAGITRYMAENSKRHGFLQALLAFIRIQLSRFLAYQVYHCLGLRAENFTFGSQDTGGLTCRRVAADELSSVTGLSDYDLSAEFLKSLSGRGDICYAAFDGSGIVGYAFFARAATVVSEGLSFEFLRDEVYVYKVFTHPRARGKRAAPLLLGKGLSELFSAGGLSRCVTLIDASNLASISAFKKLGFSILKSFHILRFTKTFRVLKT